MIARIWRGKVRSEDADQYAQYVLDTGVTDYQKTPGNLGAHLLRREVDGVTEIVALTFWESWDAVKAFAGEQPEIAKYYPEDEAVLLEMPELVEHYEVLFSTLQEAHGE